MCKDNDLPCDGRDLVANPHPKHLVCTLGDGVAEPHKLATDSPGALDVRRLYRLDAPLARRDGTDPTCHPVLNLPLAEFEDSQSFLAASRAHINLRDLRAQAIARRLLHVLVRALILVVLGLNAAHRPVFDISLCISTMGLSQHSSTAFMMAPAMTAAGAASSRTGNNTFLNVASVAKGHLAALAIMMSA